MASHLFQNHRFQKWVLHVSRIDSIVLSIDSIVLRIKSIVLRIDSIVIKIDFICATFGLLVCKIDSRLNCVQNVLNCDKNQLDYDKNWLDLCYIRLSCQQNSFSQKKTNSMHNYQLDCVPHSTRYTYYLLILPLFKLILQQSSRSFSNLVDSLTPTAVTCHLTTPTRHAQ